MKYKLYDKKKSTLKNYSRYVQGGNTDIFTERLGWWEKIDLHENQYGDIVINSLIAVYDKRPDLLSYDVYGRSDFEWIILQYNNIVDINEEFITGVKIMLPNRLRVFGDIMTNNVRIADVES